MDSSEFLQHLASGISLGSLYALIAVGYTMVYGILRLINFAHGDVFMLGAYAAFYGATRTEALAHGLPWGLAFPLAILLTAAAGVVIDLCAYKPLRNAPRVSALCSAIGVSFFLENLVIVVCSGRPKTFPQPDFFSSVYQWGELHISLVSIIIPAATLVSVCILLYVVYFTKAGLAMRAVSKDMDTARLMGVNVNRTIAVTFLLGSGLAALGGILWGLKYRQIQPLTGVLPGLKAFVAVILGGIGSIPGAVIGGMLLGISEIMLVAFLAKSAHPEWTGYRDALAFAILIIVLLLRPTGIMGEKLEEKV